MIEGTRYLEALMAMKKRKRKGVSDTNLIGALLYFVLGYINSVL